jgi:hypothetical protein
MTEVTQKISHRALLSILDKLKIERTEKIPASRAQVKLVRACQKDPGIVASVKFDRAETEALEALGVLNALAAPKKDKKEAEPSAPFDLISLVERLLKLEKSEKAIIKIVTRRSVEAGLKAPDPAALAVRIGIIRSLAGAEEGSVVKKSGKKGKAPKKASAGEETPKKGKAGKAAPKAKEKEASPAKEKAPKKKPTKAHDEEE